MSKLLEISSLNFSYNSDINSLLKTYNLEKLQQAPEDHHRDSTNGVFGVNLSIEKGDFFSLIGRNGSGKSTLVKLISGLLQGYQGNIFFKGKNLKLYNGKEISKILSFLPQSFFPEFSGMGGITVFDFLLLGRYPYKKNIDYLIKENDIKSVEFCMNLIDIVDFKGRYFHELSGGEKQKVYITLSLVQLNAMSDLSEKLLIIDEPLTYLDINHQFEMFSLLKTLNVQKKLTILIVTHDLSLAMKFTEKSILLSKGFVVAHGITRDIITESNLQKYFNVNSTILKDNKEYSINFHASLKSGSKSTT